jgi:hypothetical protein
VGEHLRGRLDLGAPAHLDRKRDERKQIANSARTPPWEVQSMAKLHRTRRSTLLPRHSLLRCVAPVAALAAAAASTALAADRPAATSMAERGTLKVVSRVLLDARGGELKGVWQDPRKPCSAQRSLRVSYLADLVAGGRTTRRRAEKTGLVQNCAEGGPNFGFDATARGLGMACASGRWRPGRYAITVRTFDRASGLRASASLYYEETRRC